MIHKNNSGQANSHHLTRPPRWSRYHRIYMTIFGAFVFNHSFLNHPLFHQQHHVATVCERLGPPLAASTLGRASLTRTTAGTWGSSCSTTPTRISTVRFFLPLKPKTFEYHLYYFSTPRHLSIPRSYQGVMGSCERVLSSRSFHPPQFLGGPVRPKLSYPAFFKYTVQPKFSGDNRPGGGTDP